jgi:hypothetical protein
MEDAMIQASLILFAIQAGVKLGKRGYDILIDKNYRQALSLPSVKSFNPDEADAIIFFVEEENRHWIRKPDGPFWELSRQEGGSLKAYRIIKGLDNKLDGKAKEVLPGIQQYEQEKNNMPKTGQRLLATVVDIGIDFFKTNTAALGLGSTAEIINGFLPVVEDLGNTLDEQKFDKGKVSDIAGKVFKAGLQVLGNNTALISLPQGVKNLLGGVTNALLKDFDGFKLDPGKQDSRLQFYDRVAESLVKGAMAGFAASPALVLPGPSGGAELVRETLTQVFQGLQSQEDLFTKDSLEIIFKNGLLSMSKNAELITKGKIIQSFLQKTVDELTKGNAKDIFSERTFAEISKIGLETLANNIATLIDPNNPQRKLLDETIAALATSLSTTLTDGKLGKLFTSKQLIKLSQDVFQEVAKNPQQLLGITKKDTPELTALAQIIASVAKSLGDDPKKLVTGEGALALLRTAIQATANNAEKLLRLDTADSTKNLLYQLLQKTVNELTKPTAKDIFSEATVAEVMKIGLETLGNNISTLIDPKNPQRVFLAESIAALTSSLSTTLAGKNLRTLISGPQITDLSRIIFQEVAKNPQQLLGITKQAKPELTTLAQIIASVAQSLGDDPKKLIAGEGALELLRTAIQTATQNADKLLRPDPADPTKNLLYQLLNATVQPLAAHMTPKNVSNLINPQVIANTATQMLLTTAVNLESFVAGEAAQIRDLMQTMLYLSTTAEFSARLNSGNLTKIFDILLQKLIIGKLDPTNRESVSTELEDALR